MSWKGWRVVLLVVLTASLLTPVTAWASPGRVALGSALEGWELWSRFEAWFLGRFRADRPEVMSTYLPKPEAIQGKEGPAWDPDGFSPEAPFHGGSVFDDAGPGWDPNV